MDAPPRARDDADDRAFSRGRACDDDENARRTQVRSPNTLTKEENARMNFMDAQRTVERRDRAESFSQRSDSEKSSVDVFDDRARAIAREGDGRETRDGTMTRSLENANERDFMSFETPDRARVLRETCERRAREGVSKPDSARLHVDVCEAMVARERAAHDGVILDVNRAHHLEYRTQLIEWILDVCAGERYAPATADVAIGLTDRVLSKTLVPKTSLHLVALCCLQIAIKYEEVEDRVPTMAKLRSWTSNMYSPDIIQKMELAVLIELKWDVGILTPAHFLESFLAVTGGGTTERDEVEFGEWNPSYREDLRQYVCYVYSLCVMDPSFTNERPSRVAAAVIGAVRLNLGIKPMCPPELRAAADLHPQEIVPLVSHILRLYSEACSEEENDDMEMDHVQPAAMSIAIPSDKAGFERITDNASPTCPLDMRWDDC